MSLKDVKAASATELNEVINQFPMTADEALDIEKNAAMTYVGVMGWERSTIQNKIALAERPGIHPRPEVTGRGVKGDAKRWYGC